MIFRLLVAASALLTAALAAVLFMPGVGRDGGAMNEFAAATDLLRRAGLLRPVSQEETGAEVAVAKVVQEPPARPVAEIAGDETARDVVEDDPLAMVAADEDGAVAAGRRTVVEAGPADAGADAIADPLARVIVDDAVARAIAAEVVAALAADEAILAEALAEESEAAGGPKDGGEGAMAGLGAAVTDGEGASLALEGPERALVRAVPGRDAAEPVPAEIAEAVEMAFATEIAEEAPGVPGQADAAKAAPVAPVPGRAEAVDEQSATVAAEPAEREPADPMREMSAEVLAGFGLELREPEPETEPEAPASPQGRLLADLRAAPEEPADRAGWTTDYVLAGLGKGPRKVTTPLEEAQRWSTQYVLDGLERSRAAVVAESTASRPPISLEQVIVEAIQEGRSEEYLVALIEELSAAGQLDAPAALLRPDGQVDSQMVLNALVGASSVVTEEAAPVARPQQRVPESMTYIVRSGDSLARIAYKFYGKTSRYTTIYEANRHTLPSPDQIKAGQRLTIPAG